MSGPLFPFAADVDPEADLAERGPIARRDLILTLALTLVGALLVGATGAVAVVQLAISTGYDDLLPIVVGGAGPLVCWLTGAVVAFIRLVRRRRAWPAPLLAIGGILVLWLLGVLWWVRAASIV